MVMTNHTNAEYILYSSIFVHAKPKRPLSVAAARMLSLPNVVQVRHGTEAEFIIKSGNGASMDPILQLEKNTIRLRFFFTEPNQKAYRSSLSIFLSLLTYLNDLYEIDIKPLYPQLIEAISGISKDIGEARAYSEAKALSVRITELSRSNAYLSDYIHGLAAKLEVSSTDCSELRGAMLKVIRYFIDHEGADPEKVAAEMQVFGFSITEAEKLFGKCKAFPDKGVLHAHKA